jgi:hypothetical protein
MWWTILYKPRLHPEEVVVMAALVLSRWLMNTPININNNINSLGSQQCIHLKQTPPFLLKTPLATVGTTC